MDDRRSTNDYVFRITMKVQRNKTNFLALLAFILLVNYYTLLLIRR